MAKKEKTFRGHPVEDATQDLSVVMFTGRDGRIMMRVPGQSTAVPVTFSRSMVGMRKRIEQTPTIVALTAPPKKKKKKKRASARSRT